MDKMKPYNDILRSFRAPPMNRDKNPKHNVKMRIGSKRVGTSSKTKEKLGMSKIVNKGMRIILMI